MKTTNKVVENALGVWDNLMDIYLDRAATEGKLGDTQEAAYWFDKANTLRMVLKRAGGTVSNIDVGFVKQDENTVMLDEYDGKLYLVSASGSKKIKEPVTRENYKEVARRNGWRCINAEVDNTGKEQKEITNMEITDKNGTPIMAGDYIKPVGPQGAFGKYRVKVVLPDSFVLYNDPAHYTAKEAKEYVVVNSCKSTNTVVQNAMDASRGIAINVGNAEKEKAAAKKLGISPSFKIKMRLVSGGGSGYGVMPGDEYDATVQQFVFDNYPLAPLEKVVTGQVRDQVGVWKVVSGLDKLKAIYELSRSAAMNAAAAKNASFSVKEAIKDLGQAIYSSNMAESGLNLHPEIASKIEKARKLLVEARSEANRL